MSSVAVQTCVLALGARTPVGLSAAASAAAVRAGISRIREHATMVDMFGDPFRVAMDRTLAATSRLERMAELARSALTEVLAELPRALYEIAVFLALPEPGPWFSRQDAQQLCERAMASFPERRLTVECFTEGNAAGIHALERAMAWLSSHPDKCCIVGGVDSLIDPDVLEALDEAGHIASSQRRWGYPPGEGAGMLALCAPGFVRQHRLGVRGRVAAVACGFEPNRAHTETICLGVGLGQVMRRAAESAPGGPIAKQYCDLNGERYREHEFSYATLRVPEAAFVNAVDYVAPVDCWGHTGAATAPLLMVLPVAHHARGAGAGVWNMVWCGSDSGQRGAVVLQLDGGMV